MYQLIRNIHLILGLLATPFLLIYAISSVFFAHSFLNSSATETIVKEYKLTSVTKNPIEMAEILSRKHNIKGKLNSSALNDSGLLSLDIARPGNHYTIVVDTNSGIVTSKEKIKNTAGFLKALHEAGFRNENSVESWWSFAIAIVSALLILIVITGLILWLYRTKDKLSGGIFLCMNIVFCITVFSVIRLG